MARKAAQADVFLDDFSSDEEKEDKKEKDIKNQQSDYEKLLSAVLDHEI